MIYSVIDSKSDKRKFQKFPLSETIITTINLLELTPGKFGLDYQADYSGVKVGKINGGPLDISGNGTYIENDDPKVTMIISNYSDSGTAISMQITINIDAPILGTVTIFDQALGGKYGFVSLCLIVKHMTELDKV
jgi:hypothetical protein